MTILPKKKESKKSENDDNIESRNRTRNRSNRDTRNRTQQDESLNDSSSHIEKRDSQENGNLPPHKRSRHRQNNSNTNYIFSQTPRGGDSPSSDVNNDGYNSSDEHVSNDNMKEDCSAKDHSIQEEMEFERQLKEKKGFHIKQMATDGACLFRSVADQIYGDQEMHGVVRKHCMDYMVKNRDFFSQYITEDFLAYIRRKRNERSHGNHVEMQALSEMYNRPIEVYQYTCEPINTFHSRSATSDENPPLRLSYHGNIHYNSIVDPYNPTVGVGLGLAGYKPKFPDEHLLCNTIQESEAQLLEQEMLEDKIKATDWEATDERLAEIAARESYVEWLRENQKTNTAGASSSTCTSTRKSSPKRSPDRGKNMLRSPEKQHSLSTNPGAGNNEWGFSLGYNAEWDSDPVLAAVLAQSQQEYLDSLTRSSGSSKSEDARL